MFSAEHGELSGGQSTLLALRPGVWLFHPAEQAPAGDPESTAKAHSPPRFAALTPSDPLGRDCVLPGSVQLGNDRPATAPAEPPAADPLQCLAPGLSPGHPPLLTNSPSQMQRRLPVIIDRHAAYRAAPVRRDGATAEPSRAADSPSGVRRVNCVCTAAPRPFKESRAYAHPWFG